MFRHNVASAGSPYTERLQTAGVIPLGKTTVSEFGLLGSTETLLSGVTRNPWQLAYSATGSSGGSAAAVACGMVPLAHASDGGGSIRIPASACGLFGFKPSRGRCAVASPDDLGGLLTEHCVSRTVRDSALLLSVTADPKSLLPPLEPFERSDRTLRIGFYPSTLMGRKPDDEIAGFLWRAAELCESLGHEVVEVSAPPVDGPALSIAFFSLAGGTMSGLEQLMQGMLGRPLGNEDLEPFTLELISWFRGLDASVVAAAQAGMRAATQTMSSFMEGFDVLLCPTMPILPPALGTLAPNLGREELVRRTESLAGYTPIHSMAGLPAMSVPLFQSEKGLPVGMHFTAKLGHEQTLFSLAYQLEESAPWANRWPALVA